MSHLLHTQSRSEFCSGKREDRKLRDLVRMASRFCERSVLCPCVVVWSMLQLCYQIGKTSHALRRGDQMMNVNDLAGFFFCSVVVFIKSACRSCPPSPRREEQASPT